MSRDPRFLKLATLPAAITAIHIHHDQDLFAWCKLHPKACSGPAFWKDRILKRYGSRALELIERTHEINYDIWYVSRESKTLAKLYEGLFDSDPSIFQQLTRDQVNEYARAGWLVVIDFLNEHVLELPVIFRETVSTTDSGKLGEDFMQPAIENGQFLMVKMMIEELHFDPNETELSCVAIAAGTGHADIAKYLAMITIPDEVWFYGAAESGSIDLWQYFEQRYPQMQTFEDFSFYKALVSGNIELVKYLIQIGFTPLQYDAITITEDVLKSNNPELLRYMLFVVGVQINQQLVIQSNKPDMIAALNQ